MSDTAICAVLPLSNTKVYHGHACVKDLDMKVREQGIYGFVGPNGAGKSTTLKMLLGLVHPTKGEIEIFGNHMEKKNRIEILREIGSLIEAPSYYGHLTTKENLCHADGCTGSKY